MSNTYKYKIEAEASMKRLLESVAGDAIEYERQRIIKELENHLGYGDSEWDADVKAVIALIKGEK